MKKVARKTADQNGKTARPEDRTPAISAMKYDELIAMTTILDPDRGRDVIYKYISALQKVSEVDLIAARTAKGSKGSGRAPDPVLLLPERAQQQEVS